MDRRSNKKGLYIICISTNDHQCYVTIVQTKMIIMILWILWILRILWIKVIFVILRSVDLCGCIMWHLYDLHIITAEHDVCIDLHNVTVSPSRIMMFLHHMKYRFLCSFVLRLIYHMICKNFQKFPKDSINYPCCVKVLFLSINAKFPNVEVWWNHNVMLLIIFFFISDFN